MTMHHLKPSPSSLRPVSTRPAASLGLVLAGLAGLGALAAAPAGAAEVAAPPAGVLNLSATATQEVTQDWMTLVLSVSKEGGDAQAVQNQLKQALDAALAEARKAQRPGQVEVQTGSFSLYPRYGQKGNMTGWHGQTELVLQGRDMATLGQLSGRIATMSIQRVAFSLARETREKLEGEVTAQAIARFRAMAGEQARAFGYAAYSLREVSVAADGGAAPMPIPRVAMAMAKSEAADALSVEPGKGQVTATVSGSVQLK